jgi:hypothetical protein
MISQQRQSDASEAFESYFKDDPVLREIYQHTRDEASGARGTPAHPLQYDESGFAIPQQRLGFTARIKRLLGP